MSGDKYPLISSAVALNLAFVLHTFCASRYHRVRCALPLLGDAAIFEPLRQLVQSVLGQVTDSTQAAGALFRHMDAIRNISNLMELSMRHCLFK
jgi:hypothetical protein